MFINNKEHATNFVGVSTKLNSENTSMYSRPETLVDYFGMYAYPCSFIGAILFSIIQLIDVNVNTIFLNKNLSLLFNFFFIIWSLISWSIFFGSSPYLIPYLGDILKLDIPYILPFNTQVVITQL